MDSSYHVRQWSSLMVSTPSETSHQSGLKMKTSHALTPRLFGLSENPERRKRRFFRFGFQTGISRFSPMIFSSSRIRFVIREGFYRGVSIRDSSKRHIGNDLSRGGREWGLGSHLNPTIFFRCNDFTVVWKPSFSAVKPPSNRRKRFGRS